MLTFTPSPRLSILCTLIVSIPLFIVLQFITKEEAELYEVATLIGLYAIFFIFAFDKPRVQLLALSISVTAIAAIFWLGFPFLVEYQFESSFFQFHRLSLIYEQWWSGLEQNQGKVIREGDVEGLFDSLLLAALLVPVLLALISNFKKALFLLIAVCVIFFIFVL